MLTGSEFESGVNGKHGQCLPFCATITVRPSTARDLLVKPLLAVCGAHKNDALTSGARCWKTMSIMGRRSRCDVARLHVYWPTVQLLWQTEISDTTTHPVHPNSVCGLSEQMSDEP